MSILLVAAAPMPGPGVGRSWVCDGWASEHRYMVKHYSGCFCEGGF